MATTTEVTITPLPTAFKPDLLERAWSSVPHPTLPLLATAHAKSVTVFSLASLTSHSSFTGGHSRSVRSAAWKPGLQPGNLCIATASFDSSAALWRWQGDSAVGVDDDEEDSNKEQDFTALQKQSRKRSGGADSENGESNDDDDNENGWQFTIVLDGHDSEVKAASFSPSGIYLATCSRDKAVWIWEDAGASEGDDEWETVAVLNEHDGDVKAVAWCPDVPGRAASSARRRTFGVDVLASASYDDTVRVWREDTDGDWVCVAVLEGHGGTVWGVEWEAHARPDDRFPRLLTFSADGNVRIWALTEDISEANDATDNTIPRIGGIPNTMRRSLREEWTCTAVLPKAHTRDVYSATWSARTGLIASTGSDGIVAVYGEQDPDTWTIRGTREAAHGPYEVNHVTWCRRYDADCDRDKRGVEEMLVTTGDDGMVKPWQVRG